MLEIGSFSAWVSVDGNEVSQFAVEHSEDGKQVICWIASEAGKNFSVSWKNSDFSILTSVRLHVDGNPCGGRISPTTNISREWEGNISGVDTSRTTQKLLMFSHIELTDDDTYLNLPTSSELGDIKLVITEVAIAGQSTDVTGVSAQPKVQQKIHERAKKGSMHCFNLGKEVTQPRFNVVRTTTIRTIGTFIFKYRPLELLQANGLAPIERKRKPISLPRDTVDLTNDDVENERTHKIRKLEAELKALKQQNDQKPKRVKIEVKNEPLSGTQFQPGEIIDLT